MYNIPELSFADMKLYICMFFKFGCRTNEERLELIEAIKNSCCVHCGSLEPNCQCWNDE